MSRLAFGITNQSPLHQANVSCKLGILEFTGWLSTDFSTSEWEGSGARGPGPQRVALPLSVPLFHWTQDAGTEAGLWSQEVWMERLFTTPQLCLVL